MAQIKIGNIIYGSTFASDITYKDTTVEKKLDLMPIFDITDNANVNYNNDYLTYANILDSLTSSDTDKALSANQGRILNEKIENAGNIDVTKLENNIKANEENITTLDNKIISIENTINNNEEVVMDLTNKINENSNSISTLNLNLESCFQSVSDGKSLVASAITDKGITTVSDATFETMATNIANINVVKTATPKTSIPNNTNSPSFSATIGKTYVVTIVAPGTTNNSSLSSGATQISKVTAYRNCSMGCYIHAYVVKATATTVTFYAATASGNYPGIVWTQIN